MDRVSGDALRSRVINKENGRPDKCRIPTDTPAPSEAEEPDPPGYSCALQMAGIAISQLSRIPADHPKRKGLGAIHLDRLAGFPLSCPCEIITVHDQDLKQVIFFAINLALSVPDTVRSGKP
jgi:hypothetical protein